MNAGGTPLPRVGLETPTAMLPLESVVQALASTLIQAHWTKGVAMRMACGSLQKPRCSGRGLPSDRASGLKRRASYFNGVSTRTADRIIASHTPSRIWAGEPPNCSGLFER
jgi:hypothetical protein